MKGHNKKKSTAEKHQNTNPGANKLSNDAYADFVWFCLWVQAYQNPPARSPRKRGRKDKDEVL